MVLRKGGMRMEFGITWDFDVADRLELDRHPFCIMTQGNRLILAKKAVFNINGKTINIFVRIHTYSGIRDLFADFFYRKEWYCHVSEKTIREIDQVIQSVYFLKSKFMWRYSPSQRYTLFRQFNRRPVCMPKQLMTVSFRGDFARVAAEKEKGLPMGEPKTYEEGLEFAARLDYDLPECDLLVFNDGDEVLWWATEQILHHNQEISKCAICQSYFVGMNSMQKYCSTKCFQSNRAVGKFCGDEEIQKLYMAIYQLFRRKINSKSVYIYATPSGETDIIRPFFPPSKKRDTLEDMNASAGDFEVAMKIFQKEYRERYDLYKNAVLRQKDGALSMEEVEFYRNELHNWLLNVKEQLSGFKRG